MMLLAAAGVAYWVMLLLLVWLHCSFCPILRLRLHCYYCLLLLLLIDLVSLFPLFRNARHDAAEVAASVFILVCVSSSLILAA